jgi:hypothetical protein
MTLNQRTIPLRNFLNKSILLLAFTTPSQSVTAAQFAYSSTDVRPDLAFELLDEEVPIEANDLIFTISPRLNAAYKNSAGEILQFDKNVEKIFNAKYSGYLLSATKSSENQYSWATTLKIFVARYNRNFTASWRPSGETPDQPDFSYLDSRAVASSIVEIRPDTPTPGENNLIILGSKIRSGFNGGSYQYRQALLLLFVDPVSGEKKTAIFANPMSQAGAGADQQNSLYQMIVPTKIPGTPEETGLVNVISAVDTLRAVSQGNPPLLDVPFHTYVSDTFRYGPNGSQQGTSLPYGQPIVSLKAGVDLEQVKSVLNRIVGFDAPTLPQTLKTCTSEDFKQLLRLMQEGL